MLVSRNRNLRVRIVDESAGGLCVASTRHCPFADGTELRLSTDDGDELAVKIVYHRMDGRRTMIGLQRNGEVPQPRREHRGTRPLILLLGLTIGLYAGFAMNTDSLRHRLAQVPPLSQLIQHN